MAIEAQIAYHKLYNKEKGFLTLSGNTVKEITDEATEIVLGKDLVGMFYALSELEEHCYECDIQFIWETF